MSFVARLGTEAYWPRNICKLSAAGSVRRGLSWPFFIGYLIVQRRVLLFIVLSLGILVGNAYLQAWLKARNAPPVAEQDAAADAKAKKDAAEKKAAKDKSDAKAKDAAAKIGEAPAAQPEKQPAQVAPEPVVEEQYFSLGSADPASVYRMVATLTNRGAALERVELNEPRYLQLEERHGYLGYMAPIDAPGGGCLVRVVGKGTPADIAGIQAGDVITRLGEIEINDATGYLETLSATRPGQEVEVTVRRTGANGQGGNEKKTLQATLVRMPAQVVRPESATEPVQIVKAGAHDPLSLLFTLQEVDGKRIADDTTELAGVRLRTGNWKGERIDERTVEFSREVTKHGLRVVKRYQIAKVDDANPNASYHLYLDVRIENLGEEPRVVAYQLDGPNGLPIEGWWFLHKNRISTEWFTSLAVRDMALRFEGRNAGLVSGLKIADESAQPFSKESATAPLVYAGVDSQYFASVLLPQRGKPDEIWFADIRPLRVGDVPADASRRKLTNVSSRLVSNAFNITPENPLAHRYQLFVGPKRPDVLASYGTDETTLSQLVYFGWTIWGVVARLMTQILHFFYGFVGNYGIAIIMLTVLVRLCMFPLSRKQALAAQKMQDLQPEMKQINEKHKGNNEARARAMQELWRKHNYNPMGGCLLAFVQLPIFIGLYRALMIDVELRGAPLLGKAVRWCSNLGAPDMLYDWSGWMPSFIADPGFGWLGPYFNVLPIITIGLFLVQQKMFMPPATDEQTAMQQKIMTYMMIFMGFLFYTVASGLCLYFIASSLWGIGEKKLLPKLIGSPSAKPPPTGGTSRAPVLVPSGGGNGAAQRGPQRKKHRGRK